MPRIHDDSTGQRDVYAFSTHAIPNHNPYSVTLIRILLPLCLTSPSAQNICYEGRTLGQSVAPESGRALLSTKLLASHQSPLHTNKG